MKWLALACVLQLLFVAVAQAAPPRYVDRTIEREGVQLNVRIEALDETAPAVLQAGQLVRLSLDGKRLADDQILSNWRIGAWLDRETDTMSGAVPVCGQRVARYLSGNLIERPLLDLTGYYVLSLDVESSVSVLDPSVSFSGRSSLYSAMKLDGKGFDWIKTSDDMRLFVALPNENKLAIADLQTLSVLNHLILSGQPTRLALQPDERLLWVGLTGANPQENAVEIIDTINDKSVARIPLPSGYHEIAFSSDGHHAFISNRQSKSMTIVDATTLKVIREVDLTFEPIGLAFVDKQSLLWIINAKAGRIHRFDVKGNPVDNLVLEPGLGPIKLTRDVRYALVVNPSQHWIHVLDIETGKEKHRITLSGQPYDILFSEQYAYIRTLQSEQIGLLSLSSLDSEQPIVKLVPAGAGALSETQNLPRASSMSLTLDRSGAFFATPSERTLYHYMEGMNAPNSGLKTFGHTPMSVMAVQRGLREVKPGQYSAVIRLPSAGRMVLALASEAPVLRECLGLKIDATANRSSDDAIAVQWLSDSVQKTSTDLPVDFRVKVKGQVEGTLLPVSQLRLRIVPARGGTATVWSMRADPKKPGEWFVSGKLSQSGGYYVHLEGNRPLKSSFSTLLVEKSKNPSEN
ncbi:MAG: YncE family protein [Nitrosomonas sp.]